MKAEIRNNLEREEVVKGQAVNPKEDGEQVKKKPVRRAVNIGRNDPCPCGSGKKYKNCHGQKHKLTGQPKFRRKIYNDGIIRCTQRARQIQLRN